MPSFPVQIQHRHAHRQHAGFNRRLGNRSQNTLLLDYGYCVTAHKAQGSEWDSVVVLEEIAQRWDPKRWRYTAVTRAKERLVYCV
jgi:ATP-dependent exoDNAse (exonuclease V) alpha subunit